MDVNIVNIKDKFSKIDELHSYKVITQMNDYYFKIVKAKRDFIWHSHPETLKFSWLSKGNYPLI